MRLIGRLLLFVGMKLMFRWLVVGCYSSIGWLGVIVLLVCGSLVVWLIVLF